MIRPFTQNPFSNNKLSDKKFIRLSTASLLKMGTTNTSGIYDELINNIKPKIHAYQIWIDKQEKLTNKEENVNSAKEIHLKSDYEKAIKKLFTEVKLISNNNADIILDFYPNGKKEFQKANKNLITDLVFKLDYPLKKYKKLLSKETIDSFKKLHDILSANTKLKQQKSTNKSIGEALRADVAVCMFENLLMQIKINITNPEDVWSLYPDEMHIKQKGGKKR